MKFLVLFLSLCVVNSLWTQVGVGYKLPTGKSIGVGKEISEIDKEEQLKLDELRSEIDALPEKKANKKKRLEKKYKELKEEFEIPRYSTTNWIEYKRLGKVIEALDTEKQLLEDSLDLNAELDFIDQLPNHKRIELENEIDYYIKEIQEVDSQRDKYYLNYQRQYLQYRRFNYLFTPTKSQAFFSLAYGSDQSINWVNDAGINFGNRSASIYSELFSGRIGVFRVSTGVLLSRNIGEDTTGAVQNDAYQRLVSNGGNTDQSQKLGMNLTGKSFLCEKRKSFGRIFRPYKDDFTGDSGRTF